MSVPKLVPIPERSQTYTVWVGAAHIGYLRWSENGDWIARTLGNADAASDLKRFPNSGLASRWLLRAVDGVQRRSA